MTFQAPDPASPTDTNIASAAYAVFASDQSKRFRRPPVLVALAALAVAVIVLLVVAGEWLAPYDPARQDLLLSAAGPGDGHWLGTDHLGRDVLSRCSPARVPGWSGRCAWRRARCCWGCRSGWPPGTTRALSTP